MSEQDQYDTLLRSMEEGLIISVNEATPKMPASGELTVEYSNDKETSVYAKGFNNSDWKIRREGDSIVYYEMTEDGLSFEDEVVSIEILGVSER